MYSDSAEADATFIAHARQDVPDLILEVRRLQADNRRLSDDLKHVSTALGGHLRPGQTPERAIMRIVGDLEACEKEREATASAAMLAADSIEEARVVLADYQQHECGEVIFDAFSTGYEIPTTAAVLTVSESGV